MERPGGWIWMERSGDGFGWKGLADGIGWKGLADGFGVGPYVLINFSLARGRPVYLCKELLESGKFSPPKLLTETVEKPYVIIIFSFARGGPLYGGLPQKY